MIFSYFSLYGPQPNYHIFGWIFDEFIALRKAYLDTNKN
jgi:hypothetical protein